MRACAIIVLATAFASGCAALSRFPVPTTCGNAPECGSETRPIATKPDGCDAASPAPDLILNGGITSPDLTATMADEVSPEPTSRPAKAETTAGTTVGPLLPTGPQPAMIVPSPEADTSATTVSPAVGVEEIVPKPVSPVAAQVEEAPIPKVTPALVSPAVGVEEIVPKPVSPVAAQSDQAQIPKVTAAHGSEPRLDSPQGQPVARIGNEIITVPDLTKAVKARLAQLPPGQAPSRRQIIAQARATLKAMVIRSLVFQEARDVLGGQESVDEAAGRIEKKWDGEELPSLIKREGATDKNDLRAKLATRASSPETLREEFVVRSMALELMGRDGSARDLDSYINALRRRRPVTSIMSPSELAAAGQQAAINESVAR